MSTLRLLRWLGPWTNQEKAPENIERKSHWIEQNNQRMKLWTYAHPKRRKGAMFVIPGIHYEGPADVRLDRFCRVLADAGIVVGCPFLPTMIDLVMSEKLLEETELAFREFISLMNGEKVGVFSISAASVAALHIGKNPEFQQHIRAIHLFGGFSSWSEALIFTMKGELSNGDTVTVDPLGLPVVFLNIMEAIEGMPEDCTMLQRAWMDFVNQTWEKPHMESPAAHSPIAHSLAESLPTEQRALFLQGCSVEPGGIEKAITAIGHYSQDSAWLDPKAVLSQLHSPLYISHGRDDFVVPYTQAEELALMCPKEKLAGRFLTGFYHHTGPVSILRLLRLIPKLPVEVYHSIQMVRAIAKTGVG